MIGKAEAYATGIYKQYTVSEPAISGVVIPKTTFTKVNVTRDGQKVGSSSTVGHGTITEKDINLKRNDIVELALYNQNFNNTIKTVEVICGIMDEKYDVDNFNVKIEANDVYGTNSNFTVYYKYFDKDGNPIKDDEGNVIVDTILNVKYQND